MPRWAKSRRRKSYALRHRADRAARVAGVALLLDGNRRGEPVDLLDFGFGHLFDELARVGGHRLDVAALPFGIDGLESKGGLA